MLRSPGRRQCKRSALIAMFHVKPLTIADGARAGRLCRGSRVRRVWRSSWRSGVLVSSVCVERCGRSGWPSRRVICSAPPAFALRSRHPAPIGWPSSSSSSLARCHPQVRHEAHLGLLSLSGRASRRLAVRCVLERRGRCFQHRVTSGALLVFVSGARGWRSGAALLPQVSFRHARATRTALSRRRAALPPYRLA